jgi:chlorophyllide a oxygenase
MEELVNDKLLQDRSTAAIAEPLSSPSTSEESVHTERRRKPRKSLNVSGPVQSYHPNLKNFWYPVAFSTDLKDDTMVSQYQSLQNLFISKLVPVILILVLILRD